METSQRPREILPKNVKPLHCTLLLHPNIEAGTFKGSAIYDLEAAEQTDLVTLNAADLKVEASLIDPESIDDIPVTYDQERERVRLMLPRLFEAGERFRVMVTFSGSFSKGMEGFYLSRFKLPDGTESTMATTQFEAADARRAFPCWDEPGVKMTYDVSMVVPAELTAISNGEVLREQAIPMSDNAMKTVVFETTPLMSTYLLAFIAGDLRCATGQTARGTVVRTWATPGKEPQCAFANDVAIQVLTFFEEYCGVPYPLPKLDQIAVPDFAAGAMENWGAVTYRETALLIDETNSSQAARKRVTEVIAHELAHQWFGNLVTMEWWDDLWLNESFATLMANIAMHQLHPEWDIWHDFIAEEMAGGMQLDGLKNSHPISVPIPRVQEVDEVFDAISYNKGGSVLRMLKAHVGDDAFKGGLRIYLKRHAYGNTKANDLWNAISEAAKDPALTELISGWIHQTGYPVVDVTCIATPEGERVCLSQRRFRYDGDTAETAQWQIPLGIAFGESGGEPHRDVLNARIDGPTHEVQLPGFRHRLGWLHANASRHGFFRVNYDEQGWAGLKDALAAHPRRLTVEERYGLQDDAFALSVAGLLPLRIFLELAGRLDTEPSYPVMAGLADSIARVHRLVADNPVADAAFRTFVRDIYTRNASRLHFVRKPDDGSNELLLRGLALQQAGANGTQWIVKRARRHFDELTAGATIDPDIRLAVYRLAAAEGGEEVHEALKARHRVETLSEEKNRLFTSMAYTNDDGLRRRTLEYAMSSDVRMQDTPFAFIHVAAQPRGARLAWGFVKEHWAEICERYKGSKSLLGRFVTLTTEHLSTPEDLADVKAFLAAHPVDSLTRTFEQVIERVTINLAWRERNLPDLLKRFGSDAT